MKKFEWSDELSVGVSEMDDQHQILLSKINNLAEALEEGSNENVVSCLDDMAEFVVIHFRDEEALMEKESFEGLDNHKKIHARLLEQVGEIRADVVKGEFEKEQVVTFLKMWLAGHIMGIDKEYGTFITDK